MDITSFQKSREVIDTIKITGKTIDTNDDVFLCRREGSFAEGCVHSKGINIWGIHSVRKGDLKRMLSDIVSRFNENRIMFTMVINPTLKRSLHGFKEKQVYWDKVGEDMTVLEGVWVQ